MSTYSVRGFTAVTGTTDPIPIAQLWNPSSTVRIKLMELGLTLASTIPQATQSNPDLIRTTARGTAGSTVTPDADNAWDNLVAPASGALLDLSSFSGNPTTSGPALLGWNLGAGVTTGTAGAGWVWSTPRGIEIPPGQGILIEATISGANSWPASEVYFVWEEGD